MQSTEALPWRATSPIDLQRRETMKRANSVISNGIRGALLTIAVAVTACAQPPSVPVHDVENPARTPFVVLERFALGTSNGFFGQEVPTSKRFVIEFVSFDCTTARSSTVSSTVGSSPVDVVAAFLAAQHATSTSKAPVRYRLIVHKQGTIAGNAALAVPTTDHYAVSQSVRLYADSGPLFVSASLSERGMTADCEVAVSGYLVDVP
jgi:hypothetical protein